MKNCTKFFVKAMLLLLLPLLWSYSISAQSVANYTYSTSATGSLVLDNAGNTVDMSSGTTLLIGPSLNTVNTLLTDIGFDFIYNGVRANKFNVTAHGLLGLFSNTGTPLTVINNIGGGTSNRVGAFVMGTNTIVMGTHSTGKVHSKVFGTFPNRVLLIEWLNMSIPSTSVTADATFQVRLYEAGSTIEYVYGNMISNAPSVTAIKTGFATSTAAGAAATVDFTTTPSTPIYNTTTATGIANTVSAVGAITPLHSTANGARRIFKFDPPVVAAPTALTFSPVGASTMTLNWTDNATNELGYLVYRSDDGGSTYALAATLAANTATYATAGLSSATNYYWRIAAYKEGMSGYLAGNQATTAVGGTITSTGTGGLWSQSATWVGGAVPTADNNVTIASSATVTIDVATGAYDLVVSGNLIFEAITVRTLSVGNNLTINSGATLTAPTTGTVITHVLNVFNNITNNGTLDLSVNTAGVELRFSGINSATYSGTGATNDMYLLTMNKAVPSGIATTTSPVVEVSLTNMTGKGAVGAFVNFVTMTGILKFSGTNTFTNILFTAAGYTIPITGGLWINNPNMTLTGLNGSPLWNGLLRVSAGTANFGNASGNQLSGGANATYIFEGGTTNFSGRFLNSSAITLTITGGTINVATVGNASSSVASFGFASTANTITISGGTINLKTANSAATKLDYTLSGASNITGGTLNVNGTAATTYTIIGNTPNLVVNNTCTAKLSGVLQVIGDITVGAGSSIDAATFNLVVFGQSATNPGNITNNGTIINAAITTAGTNNANRLQMFGSFGSQTITGTGTIGNATTTLSGLGISNSAGVSVGVPIFTNRVNLFNGTISNANNITIGNSYATPVLSVVQIGGSGTILQGSMGSSAPVFNVSTSGLQLLYSAGTGNISTGTEIPSSRSVNFLTINNANLTSLTLTGGNLAVTNTLACSAGNMFLGANTLTAGTMTGGSATSHIITDGTGKLASSVSTTAVTFPVGANATMYDPVVLTENAAVGNTYAVKVENGAVINNPADPTKTVQKNWDISKVTSNTSNVNATLTYDATTTVGANYNPAGTLVVGHWNSVASKWDEFPGTISGTSVSVTGLTSFSPFAIANATALLPIELISFTAKRAENDIRIDWATASESNNEKFEIERSQDGKNFIKVGSKNGRGTTTYTTNYDFTDKQAPQTILYYRLKQTDFDTKFTYTQTIAIDNRREKEGVLVYPNPATELLYFQTENQDQPIFIYNTSGLLVKKLDTVPSSLSISDLPTGIYLVKTETESIRLIKE